MSVPQAETVEVHQVLVDAVDLTHLDCDDQPQGVKEVVAAGDPGAAGHELFQIVIGQEAKPLIFGSSQLSLRIRSGEVDDVINMGLSGQPL